MKLWLLKPIEAWDPWYDKADGFVVRAQNVKEARKLAADCHGDEGRSVWLNAQITTCVELTADGPPEAILRDFSAG